MITSNYLKNKANTRALCCYLKILFYCVFTIIVQETVLANSVDTIKTDAQNIYILAADSNIVLKKEEGLVSEKYVLCNLKIKDIEIKSLLDSSIWREYYEGKIMQGHARFLFFIISDVDGRIEDVCFSEAFTKSNDEFFDLLKSIIRKTIKGNQSIFESKVARPLNSKTFYFSSYRINLYP